MPGTLYPGPAGPRADQRADLSGGEDLCYTLQALGPAQVIGETTGGGAHLTRLFPVSPGGAHRDPVRALGQPGRRQTGRHRRGARRRRARGAGLRRGVARALEHVLAMDGVPPPITDEARDALAALPATARAERSRLPAGCGQGGDLVRLCRGLRGPADVWHGCRGQAPVRLGRRHCRSSSTAPASN